MYIALYLPLLEQVQQQLVAFIWSALILVLLPVGQFHCRSEKHVSRSWCLLELFMVFDVREKTQLKGPVEARLCVGLRCRS